MPAVAFTDVLSFSSEDPNHPAENLLRSDAFRKWKCALGSSSEKQATVTLKLECLTSINSIDIGNEGSAFVEVLVAREEAPDFKVLLVASSFMTPIESRNGSDLSRVRMFGMDKLNKNVAEQKWDQVKVICTQPFNKKLQYGLSFITIRAPDQEAGGSASKLTKLGSFTLKEEDDTDPITTGSLFSRLREKEHYREAYLAGPHGLGSLVGGITKYTTKVPRINSAGANTSASPAPQKRKAEDQIPESTFYQLKKPSKDENSTKKNQEKGEERAREKKNDIKADKNEEKEKPGVKVKEEKKERGEKNKGETSTPKGERNKRSEKASEKDGSQERKSRPFTSLMEDVVFVLSGYQNPERSQLRDAMVEMGATYKADWGTTSTHLICAFKNTPKYQQVQGKGRIVTAKWVTQCHKDKKRYPCRRFELEKRRGGDESEEEVWADELLPKKPKPPNKDVTSARLSPKPDPDEDVYGEDTDTSDNEDTDDEIERAKARKTKDTQQSPKLKNSSKAAEPPSKVNTSASTSKKRPAGDSEGSPSTKRKAKAVKVEEAASTMNGMDAHTDDEVYEDDTDVDEEPDQHQSPPDTSALPLPPLGDYFKGKTFMVYGSLGEDQKKLLTRYIIAFKGEVESYMNEKVQFVVSEDSWDDNFDEALNENPSLQFVKPLWVWRCCDKQKLLPHQPYLIVPKE